jgi:hypothetical protein
MLGILAIGAPKSGTAASTPACLHRSGRWSRRRPPASESDPNRSAAGDRARSQTAPSHARDAARASDGYMRAELRPCPCSRGPAPHGRSRARSTRPSANS